MYRAVAIGASAGGMYAIRDLLKMLPSDFALPILIVQHMAPTSENYMVEYLDKHTEINVKEADEKEKIKSGTAYIAPPNYHLLVEEDESLSLSADEKVNYSRPSIDILFFSASDAYRKNLIGVVLTGANDDGSKGLAFIRKQGGLAIVQNPSEAESPQMPNSAILAASPQHVLTVEEIGKLLLEIDSGIKKQKV